MNDDLEEAKWKMLILGISAMLTGFIIIFCATQLYNIYF